MSFDKIFDLTAGVYFLFYDLPGMQDTYTYNKLGGVHSTAVRFRPPRRRFLEQFPCIVG